MCFDPWVWELPSLTLLRNMALTFHTLPDLIIPTHSYRALSLTLFHPNDLFPCPRLPNNTYSPLLYRTYLILFHPTRSLVYHTQPVSLIPCSIFIKYSFPILPYPIILKLNRIDPRPKRLGSAHHQNLPRPKSPGRNDTNSVVCTAKMLKSFGLVYSPILQLKNVFWREFMGKSEAVHTPLKCKQSRYASKQNIIGYQENVLRTWYAHF